MKGFYTSYLVSIMCSKPNFSRNRRFGTNHQNNMLHSFILSMFKAPSAMKKHLVPKISRRLLWIMTQDTIVARDMTGLLMLKHLRHNYNVQQFVKGCLITKNVYPSRSIPPYKGMPHSCVVAPPLEWCNRSFDAVLPPMVAKQIFLDTQAASISCFQTPKNRSFCQNSQQKLLANGQFSH